MKKFALGLILGILISTFTIATIASTQSFTLEKTDTPIYINNVKYPTDALPILNLEIDGAGNTYVPLRNIAEMLGAEVNYDEVLKKINISIISTSSNNNTNSNSTISNNNYNLEYYYDIIDDVLDDDLFERNKVQIYTFEGKSYIKVIDVNNKIPTILNQKYQVDVSELLSDFLVTYTFDGANYYNYIDFMNLID